MGVGIAELRETLSEYAAGFDAALLTAAQAEEVVEEAARIEHMAATVKGFAAARLASTGTWRAQGERSAAHSLARRTGTSVVAAAAALDTARRLETLPATAAAARRGELSPEQASAIVDAAGADANVERELLEAARRSPLAELRERCARTKAAAGIDPEARRSRIHQRRSLRSFTDAEGAWHLHCRNNPEVGARIMAAVDTLRETIFRQARSQGRHEPPDAYAADALAEMARLVAGGDAEASEQGAEPVEEVDAPSTDLGGEGSGPKVRPAPSNSARPARRAGVPKVIVRVDLGALLRGFPTEGEVCKIAGFGPVAVSAVRDLIDSDDPFLTAVVTRGQQLTGVAHLGRRPNALQQTALQWLYPSCANEACSAQARLDYDHRLDWARSHLTVLDLLDRLCSHCHALKTRQNWSLVEGRGKRALVPPDDGRHPRHASPEPRPPPARC